MGTHGVLMLLSKKFMKKRRTESVILFFHLASVTIGARDIFRQLHHPADSFRLFDEAIEPFHVHLDEKFRRTFAVPA